MQHSSSNKLETGGKTRQHCIHPCVHWLILYKLILQTIEDTDISKCLSWPLSEGGPRCKHCTGITQYHIMNLYAQ